MNLEKINDLFVSIDSYITVNSVTLNFIAFIAALLIVLFILFYLYRVNRTIKDQNKKFLEYFMNIERNSRIDRSLDCVNEFNSSDFRIKVLSVLEIKLKMHENNLGDNQSIVNDAEFRYAILNCIHFFNNTGYLFINGYLENSIILNNLSSLSVEWFKKLEPYFQQDLDKAKYWKEANQYFNSGKVLTLDEEINPISEKSLF